jgi:holo-[acyl-carrier protein] synthase
MVLGHGIDIIDLDRVRRHLMAPDSAWVAGTFTDAERSAADPSPHDVEYYAGRFAAKEAVAKALGTGIRGEMSWMDIEILRQPSGNPTVSLTNEARAIADRLGVARWLVSISHSQSAAIASAIALAE